MMTTAQTIRRPQYQNMTVADALRADWRGWHLSQKMDGVWHVAQFNGCTLAGEKMKDGRFYAFDIVTAYGEDIRRLQWHDRRTALIDLARKFPNGWQIAPEGNGAEFLEMVLRDGHEGVVFKRWDAPFYADAWIKAKRTETFDCFATETNIATGSIRLALNGEDCGWCPARAAFNQIHVGDVVEIAAYGRHVSGKFREARFVRVRRDKTIEVKPAELSAMV